MPGSDAMMGDGVPDYNAVMNDINSAAQRFFVDNDVDSRGIFEDRSGNGDIGFTADPTAAARLISEESFQPQETRFQDERDGLERIRQDQAAMAMFRTMRDEIMRLQRENRCLTRQLSIARHELRTVCNQYALPIRSLQLMIFIFFVRSIMSVLWSI